MNLQHKPEIGLQMSTYSIPNYIVILKQVFVCVMVKADLCVF